MLAHIVGCDCPACCHNNRCARCRDVSSGLRQQRSLGRGCSSRRTWRCHRRALRWCRCVPWATCVLQHSVSMQQLGRALLQGGGQVQACTPVVGAFTSASHSLLSLLPAARIPSQGAPQHALCSGHSSHAQAPGPRRTQRHSCSGACAIDCSADRHWCDRCAVGVPVPGLSAPTASLSKLRVCMTHASEPDACSTCALRLVPLQAPASQALCCSGRVLTCLRPSAHSRSLWRTCRGAGRLCQTCPGMQVSC